MKKSKKKQASNKPFMEYVAKHNCCLMSHSSDVVSSSCGGGVQAHHLLKPWDGFRGMGMRARDNNCVPLCYKHHALLHDKYGNEDKFWTMFNLPENYGRGVSQMLWHNFNYGEPDGDS